MFLPKVFYPFLQILCSCSVQATRVST
jgi:hypothetical protein